MSGETFLKEPDLSSGALEMAVIKGFTILFDLNIPTLDMTYIGKSAENDFVGVRSGIMINLSAY
ncbi:hypothetical protein KEJ21_00345 [Candidatus Bathyarchaeota archaeon]|nr:hypothetical protein [Candidatus Bathyarchaeota archaeon]MBS7630010.1 hypothetical protein [Candidatus Bathyarchaeota archaeon]